MQEKEEEGRLALEELELRFKSVTAKEDSQVRLSHELELKITQLSGEKQQLQSQLSTLKTELNTVCEQIKDELKDELDSLQQKLQETQTRLDESQSEVSNLKGLHSDEKEQLESQIKSLTIAVADDKDELIGENERLKSEMKLKETELDKVESTLKAIEVELETQLSSNSQLNESYEKLQNVQLKYDNLKSEFEDKLNELKNCNHQLEESDKVNKDYQAQLKTALDNLEAFKQEVVEKKSIVIDLEKSLEVAKEESNSNASQLEKVMSQLAQVDENHNSSLAAIKKKSTDLEKEILELKNREASLKGNEQQMIAYQKELQDQIGTFEKTEANFQRQLQQAKQKLSDKGPFINRVRRKWGIQNSI